MFAFVFESVGSGEWLVLLAVILIVVGPKNLPSAARKMGQVMSKLRRAADEFKRQIMTMDEEMKKAADDIKRDYIDIPDDSADKSITDIAGDDASSDDPGYDNPDDPAHMSDYPEGYPEDDYYGASAGMDADVASNGPESDGGASSAPEAVASDPSAGEAASSEAAATYTPETAEAVEKKNG